jgi:Right handed beta helix region
MIALSPKLALCSAVTTLALLVPSSVAASQRSQQPMSASPCQLVAGLGGSDRNRGTPESPYATVSRLVGALQPGETGCLLSGRYRTDIHLSKKGRRNARLTLRAAPGATVTICGFVVFKPGASFWRLTRLEIDGSCSSQNTVQIYANHATLDHDNVTNRHLAQSCVMVGAPGYGHGRYAAIHHNRIHDCGSSGSHYYHGIYANSPRDARITDNFVYDNAGFGIHLYPDAQSTEVERNVVDGNYNEGGLVFAGSSTASSNNFVKHNVFSDNGAYGVSSSWGGPVGDANVVVANCFWRNEDGPFDPAHRGFVVRRNVEARPDFIATTPHDYRIRRGSRCRKMQPHGHVGP